RVPLFRTLQHAPPYLAFRRLLPCAEWVSRRPLRRGPLASSSNPEGTRRAWRQGCPAPILVVPGVAALLYCQERGVWRVCRHTLRRRKVLAAFPIETNKEISHASRAGRRF